MLFKLSLTRKERYRGELLISSMAWASSIWTDSCVHWVGLLLGNSNISMFCLGNCYIHMLSFGFSVCLSNVMGLILGDCYVNWFNWCFSNVMWLLDCFVDLFCDCYIIWHLEKDVVKISIMNKNWSFFFIKSEKVK